jgi:diguanylate cyclase (GGDEF)-like protein
VDSAGECFDSRPVGHGVSEYTLRVGHSVLLDMAGIEALVRAGEVDAEAAGTPAVSWLGAPLLGPDGAMGLVAVQSYREQVVYDPDDADLLTFVSHQIASSVERLLQAEALYKLNAELERRVQDRTAELRMQIAVREQVQEQLKHQVLHDPLTELPNRVHLRERLQRALAREPAGDARRFALLYLDVDRFKLFNDSFGHAVGDAVLREVSRRLQTCVREPDLVSRLSGDEFAILLEHCDEAATACRVAERIQSRLEAPIAAGERELRASVSIGIAISSPGCHGVDSVLHDADTALYRAKAAGRNRYVVHDPSLDGAGTNVLDLALQLRNALTLNQLQPHFQPIVRLDDGAVVGYEALVRWQHPVRGLLAPGAFLPVAQETGLIEAVDWHMYRIACAAARPLVAPGRYLTLNVSAPHFQREDFGQRLLALLAEIGFDPRCLRLEVTEGTLLADPQAVARILQGLLEAGVEAALDDFGTGYSSLGYVHRFPLRMIKIDRTFVTHLGQAEAPRSTAIVGAVLSLTQALGMELVAEGVENEAQRQALIALGCRHAQGYLFGRPAPAACWLALDVPARPEVGAGGAG